MNKRSRTNLAEASTLTPSNKSKPSNIAKGGYQTYEVTQEKIETFMPKTGKNSVGIEGEMQVSSYYNEETKIDNLNLTDYRRMKDNDGEIQMLLNAIHNSIISAGYQIMDDDEYMESNKESEKKEDSAEKIFIEENLSKARWQNGMSRSMELTNRTSLRALEEGHITYEVIYRVDDDSKIRLDKLAPRIAKYSDFDLRIITDNSGNFFGFHQIAFFKSKTYDVIVVNESDINRTINVVYGEEYGSNYGRSAIKAAWYHYDKLHKALYIMHRGLELGSIKLRSVKKLATTSDAADDVLMAVLTKVGEESVIMYDGNKYEVVFEDASDAGVMAQGMEIVQYHTSQIAKTLLAQFIDMGTQGNTGNRALGETGKDFFKSGLQAMARIIIDNNWNKIIADLIKINFDSGRYPTYVTNPIDDETMDSLFEAFNSLVTSGALPESIKSQLLEKVGDKMGLDVDNEKLLEEMQETKVQESQDKMNELKTTMQMKSQFAPKKTNLAEEDEVFTQRPLYPDEQKVKLLDIKAKLENTEAFAKDQLSYKLQIQKTQIINQYISAINSGRKILPNVSISLADGDNQRKYSEALLALAIEMLEYGKTTAAFELTKEVPATIKSIKDTLIANITRILKKQEADLEFRLSDVAQRVLSSNIPENEARLLLENEYTDFVNKTLPPTVDAVVPESMNQGRKITFEKYNSDIFAYRYTAVIDGRTTDYCKSLDGQVFQSTDPSYAMLTPPNHFGCRSIWTPITKVEQKANNVVVDGKPAGLPVYGSISTFTDLEDKPKQIKENQNEINLVDETLEQLHQIRKERESKLDQELEELLNLMDTK